MPSTSFIPLSPTLGKVFGIGKQQFNVFLAGDYYVADRRTDPKWNIKVNITLLFPE